MTHFDAITDNDLRSLVGLLRELGVIHYECNSIKITLGPVVSAESATRGSAAVPYGATSEAGAQAAEAELNQDQASTPEWLKRLPPNYRILHEQINRK